MGHTEQNRQEKSSKLISFLKLVASGALLVSSIVTYNANRAALSTHSLVDFRRHLSSVSHLPTYMKDLMSDLDARKKLFDETPPEEVKYWFEYTGPLQVSEKRSKIEAFFGTLFQKPSRVFMIGIICIVNLIYVFSKFPNLYLHCRNTFIVIQDLVERQIILKEGTIRESFRLGLSHRGVEKNFTIFSIPLMGIFPAMNCLFIIVYLTIALPWEAPRDRI
jgi:hypothetical protein